MIVTEAHGNWLEKEIKTSPEDSFIRSEIKYKDGGKTKYFHLVYVGYFEEAVLESLQATDPVLTVSGKEVNLRDMTAFIALIKHPEYRNQKRVYIHNDQTFKALFEGIYFEKVKEAYSTLLNTGKLQLDDSAVYLNRTQVG